MKPPALLTKPNPAEVIPLPMRVSITRKPGASYGFRTYVATVETGPKKGLTFESTVIDCGQGAAAFLRRMKAIWPKAYTA